MAEEARDDARNDTREALAGIVFARFRMQPWDTVPDHLRDPWRQIADAILAAGFRKQSAPEITGEAALQDEREALATLLDEVHDDCVTEGGCEFVGWQRGWRPFDRSEPSRHVDAIIASPVWRNRHRVPVGEGEQ